MNILYCGKYRIRINDVINTLTSNDKSVLDLCFGDILLATYCKKHTIIWTGYDINDQFVRYAFRHGFNAKQINLLKQEHFEKADVCLMSGSLYHFHHDLETILKKMLDASPKLIISEPIQNISSSSGIIGYLAQYMTNAGKGKETFRFNEKSFVTMLEHYKCIIGFEYRIVSVKKDILVEIKRNPKN